MFTQKALAPLALLAVLSANILSAGCIEAEPGVGLAEISGRPYFQVWEADNDRFYFRLKAANHQTILSSQGYSTRTAALGGLLSVQKNAPDAGRFVLLEAKDGSWYFNLKAGNGQVIGTSQMYTRKYSAKKGIEAVSRNVNTYNAWSTSRTGARFDVFQGSDDRFYFRLHAANGATVLRSQGYSTEAAALNGTFSVAENGIDVAAYDVREASNGDFYFNLHAANGQIVGTSELYASKFNAERGCESVIEVLYDIELL